MGLDDLADERESVRVNTRRSESEDDVASGNVEGREEKFTLDGTDGEPSNIVVV